MKDDQGKSPVDYARENGHFDVARFLMDAAVEHNQKLIHEAQDHESHEYEHTLTEGLHNLSASPTKAPSAVRSADRGIGALSEGARLGMRKNEPVRALHPLKRQSEPQQPVQVNPYTQKMLDEVAAERKV